MVFGTGLRYAPEIIVLLVKNIDYGRYFVVINSVSPAVREWRYNNTLRGGGLTPIVSRCGGEWLRPKTVFREITKLYARSRAFRTRRRRR